MITALLEIRPEKSILPADFEHKMPLGSLANSKADCRWQVPVPNDASYKMLNSFAILINEATARADIAAIVYLSCRQ